MMKPQEIERQLRSSTSTPLRSIAAQISERKLRAFCRLSNVKKHIDLLERRRSFAKQIGNVYYNFDEAVNNLVLYGANTVFEYVFGDLDESIFVFAGTDEVISAFSIKSPERSESYDGIVSKK